jgi:hypothetical protein
MIHDVKRNRQTLCSLELAGLWRRAFFLENRAILDFKSFL